MRRLTVADHGSILSLNGLLLFQVVRGGIEFVLGLRLTQLPSWKLGLNPWCHRHNRILTLDLIRSEHTDDEVSNLSFCRQTARNGYVFDFSFFGSNVSPFFQTLSATAAILRASVNRAISARIPFCSSPST